jgi:O-acetylhomoserine/O-acetylserine sulfhydrylase-like pyridoxal-dependent enzyme
LNPREPAQFDAAVNGMTRALYIERSATLPRVHDIEAVARVARETTAALIEARPSRRRTC